VGKDKHGAEGLNTTEVNPPISASNGKSLLQMGCLK